MKISWKAVTVGFVSGAAAAAIYTSMPVANADPQVSCSPQPTCQVRGSWERTVTGLNGGAWEKIWPGKVGPTQPVKGPWEKAFENAPMP